jgi:hypothetical protein
MDDMTLAQRLPAQRHLPVLRSYLNLAVVGQHQIGLRAQVAGGANFRLADPETRQPPTGSRILDARQGRVAKGLI